MTSIRTFILFALLFVALAACQNSGAKQEEATENTEANTETADTAKEEKVLSLHARFVEFTLGDAAHFVFEDKSGNQWDFGGCDDTSLEFAKELSIAETNEINQGWTSNASLQNKWFDLKYVVRQQPMYIDGPIGDVMVIIEAKAAQ